MNLYFLAICGRVVASFSLFGAPGLAILSELFLDTVDGDLAARAKFSYARYALIDKLMDLFWFFMTLLYSYYRLPYFPVLLFLFVYRLFGQILYFFKYDPRLLAVFGNYYENIFIAIFMHQNTFLINFLKNPIYLLIYYSGAVLLKFWQEYFIHLSGLTAREVLCHLPKRNWAK